MKFTHALKMVTATGAGAIIVLAGAPAYAGGGHGGGQPAVRTITTKLNGPFGLDVLSSRVGLVAESDSGQVTAVDLRSGRRTTVISQVAGVSGVAATRGRIFALIGGPNPEGPTPSSKYPRASVLVSDAKGRHVRVLADLLKYELRHNPDGQKQFDKSGKPFDALSNPFSMVATQWGLLVADGGANDVLKVDPGTGRVSTFFVPPNPKTQACLAEGAQANPGTIGCDPVPTGLAVQGRYVYVSTLGAESKGAAAIYKLDGRTGKVLKKWSGFTSLTGVAVSPRGTIYASEVLFGAPAGDPPAGFDPSKVGRLTRIEHGRVTHAAVTMPTGLEFAGGRLYATSWSIAGQLGIKDAGRLVQVNPSAFH